jgi:hypothetical protein
MGHQLTVCLVIDEMFRDRMAHWAKVLDLLTLTTNGVALLASFRASALLPGINRNRLTDPDLTIDQRRNLAIAYMQVSRLNR